MRIAVISVQSADAAVMAGPAERLEGLGIDTEIFARNSTELDDDVLLFSELTEFTKTADFVYIRCMSDADRFKRFEKYRAVLRACPGIVLLYSGNADVTLMNRDLFCGTDEEYRKICTYCARRGTENEYGMYVMAARLCGLTDAEPPEPTETRADGIYHPRFPLDVTKENYLGSLIPGRPTVGIFFNSSNWVYKNLKHIDRMVEIFESKGMNVIPVFYTASAYRTGNDRPTYDLFRRYFTDGGKVLVDAVVAVTPFSVLGSSKDTRGLGTPADENFFLTLTDVPVIHAITVTGEYKDFETDKIGLDKHDLNANTVFPEVDGEIIGFPISYTPTGSGKKHAVPIDDRISRTAYLVYRWASLRSKPPSERKVAILMWQSRPDRGRIGDAAGLDTPESIAVLLQELKAGGYTVENVPGNGKELMREVLENVTNDLDNIPTPFLRKMAAAIVPDKDYSKEFSEIPAWDREQMERSWGEPPGTICVDGHDIVIPGIVKGNIYLGYQPLRGSADKMEENIHDPDLFAQHQYLAFYRWIRDTFKADMVIHVGTHGTVEWLPGKNVGMSGKCDPDVVLGGLPNLYFYIVDDPGEGIQCKRRANSVLIGHMPPTMARAGEYDELSEVEIPLQDYFRLRGNAGPERLKELVNQIYESARKHHLFNDLGLAEDPGPEGFEKYVIPLHEYLTEVKDALIRSGLHVLGKIPEGTHLDETVYSLVRTDNGNVRSVRDTFAENAGVDLGSALADPSAVLPSGRTAGEEADGIDAEFQRFLEWARADGYDPERCLAHLSEIYGNVSPDLEEGVRYICRKVVPGIKGMTDEIGNALRGLDGRYVPPGPSGAPTRGNADILPMGRNFYGLDPDTVPNRTAWEIGKRMADQMIEKYVSEKGEFPREIGFIVWATDTMKTGGDDIAYLLWLMGVKPVWSETGGQVTGLEVVPLSELKRPRADVSVNITGLFRDTFPNLIDLLDDAVRMIGGLDESEEDNALAANLRKDIAEDIANGLDRKEATERNSVRIFGAPPGGYGTGVNKAIETGSWKTVEDLADVYIDWCSNGYSRGNYGVRMRNEFVRRFGKVSVTVKNMPDREIDLLDCDDVYEYLGGMNTFVRAYGKKDAVTFIGDGSDPKKTKVRGTKEELRFVFRSKVLNPKFINGLKEHGYRGAAEMANIAEYTMAWGATSDAAEDWMFEGMADRFLLDKDTREWMMDENPYAAMDILNTMEESIERGIWGASEYYKGKIADLYSETEARIEELSDRRGQHLNIVRRWERMRWMLRSKIHRATVTEARLDYEGSITIDADLVDRCGMRVGEKVTVAVIETGARFETYILPGERGSGIVALNGAAARLAAVGDRVIIMGYELTDDPIRAKVVLVDMHNRVTKELYYRCRRPKER